MAYTGSCHSTSLPWEYFVIKISFSLFSSPAIFLLMAVMEMIQFFVMLFITKLSISVTPFTTFCQTFCSFKVSSWYLLSKSPEGLPDSCGFPFDDLTISFFTDCGANCHKQCRDLLVLACRKFSRGTSVGSNHGSLPSSPSLPPGESSFPPVLNHFWKPL